MIEYIKQGQQGSVIVDHRVGNVIKTWTHSGATVRWLLNHTSILDIVAPGQVVDFGGSDGCVYIALKYIDGINLNDWTVTHIDDRQAVVNMWKQAVYFWVDNIVDTFPYAHWDWHSNNTIITDCHPPQFQLIDWDGCRVSTLDNTRRRLVERLESASRKTSLNIKSADVFFNHIIEVATDYFDERVAGLQRIR